MKVLVTGGAGFIGSHTVDLLLSKGYQVRVFDSLQERVHPHGWPSWVPAKAERMQGDVADPLALGRAMDGVDLVIHLAAYQDYLQDFSHFIHANAESSALIYELAVADRKRFPVQKIVFASSQSVAGEGRYWCKECGGQSVPTIHDQLAARNNASVRDLPSTGIREPDPRPLAQLERGDWEVHCPRCNQYMTPLLIPETTARPGTAYGISKYAIEQLGQRLGSRYGIPAVSMRYTYVQGPRNSFYNAYSGIARRFALRLMHGLSPVIYEDGRQLRDFIHVSDVARANVLVLEDPRANHQVFNVGGGKAVTVREFADLMVDEFETDLEPSVPGEFRWGDTRHTVSDNSKLEALGWRPTRDVRENVRDYVAWIKTARNTKEFLDEAEKVLRQQGVVRQATSTSPGR